MVYFRFVSFRLVEKIPTRMFKRSSALCLARRNGIRFSRRGNDAVFLTESPFPSKQKPLFHILVIYCMYHVFLNFYFIFMAVWFSSKFICDGKQET